MATYFARPEALEGRALTLRELQGERGRYAAIIFVRKYQAFAIAVPVYYLPRATRFLSPGSAVSARGKTGIVHARS